MNTSPPKPTRENVAIHEAGHAVIAFLTGYHVVEGAIDIDGQNGSKQAITPLAESNDLVVARCAEGWIIDEFERRKQRCAIAAAGFTAEKICAMRTSTAFDENAAYLGAHGDAITIKEIWGKAALLTFSERLLPEMNDEQVWTIVEDLADALVESQTPISAQTAMLLLHQSRERTGAKFRLFMESLQLTSLPSHAGNCDPQP